MNPDTLSNAQVVYITLTVGGPLTLALFAAIMMGVEHVVTRRKSARK